MTELRHAIGENVRLVLSVVTAGAGVTGLTPTAAIRRQSDGFWFNGTISAPTDPFASAHATNAMAALDATNLPGMYFFDFPQARDTQVVSDYEVRLQSTSATLAIDDLALRMGPLAATLLPECSIFGTVKDGAGSPIPNSIVRATPIPVSVPSAGQGIAMTPPVLAMTNALGFFSISLVQGINIRLEIPDVGYDNQVLVPNVTSTPFSTFI